MELDPLRSLLMTPPNPVGTGSSPDWKRVEDALATPLPSDYKRFVASYGLGAVDNYLSIFNPFTKRHNLIELLANERERHRILQPGLELPYPMYPEPGGLLPWGERDGGVCYWVTSASDPDSWVVFEYQDFDWAQFDGSMTEFLVATLTGQYHSVNLGSDFPSTSPAYFDALWEPHFVRATFADSDRSMADRIRTLQEILTAIIRRTDPASSESYLDCDLIVPTTSWRLHYNSGLSRDRSANDDSGPYRHSLSVDCPSPDFESVMRTLVRLSAAMDTELVDVKRQINTEMVSVWTH